jgi:FkbM family methyltransferase
MLFNKYRRESIVKRKIFNWLGGWISYFALQPLLRRVRPSDVVIDCGANVGDITSLFAKRGAIVHAFEPDPRAFARLRERFAGHARVVCHENAVSHQASRLRLFFHDRSTESQDLALTVGSSVVAHKIGVDPQNFAEVEAIDLIRFIHELGQPVRVLKMDIEGAEIPILRRFIEEKVYEKVETTLVETHERMIPGQKEEVAAIKETIKARGIDNIKLTWI